MPQQDPVSEYLSKYGKAQQPQSDPVSEYLTKYGGPEPAQEPAPSLVDRAKGVVQGVENFGAGLVMGATRHTANLVGKGAQAEGYLLSRIGRALGGSGDFGERIQRGGERLSQAAADIAPASSKSEVGGRLVSEIGLGGAEYIAGGGIVRAGLAEVLPAVFAREVAPVSATLLERAAVGGREALRDIPAYLPVTAAFEAGNKETSTAAAIAKMTPDTPLGRLAAKAESNPLTRTLFAAGLQGAGDLAIRGLGTTVKATEQGIGKAVEPVSRAAEQAAAITRPAPEGIAREAHDYVSRGIERRARQEAFGGPEQRMAERRVGGELEAARKMVASGPEPVSPAPSSRIVSLTKEEGAAIRTRLGLGSLDAPSRQTFAEAWDRAASDNLSDHAIQVAQDAVSNKRALLPEEHAAAVQKYLSLEQDLTGSRSTLEEAARMGNDEIVRRESLRTSAILQQIDELTTATDRAGTEAGRALSIRRLRADSDTYTLASGLQSARTKKGMPLTTEEIGRVEGLTRRVDELAAENTALRERNDAVNAIRERDLAQATIQTEAKAATRMAGKLSDLEAESAQIKKQLAEMGLKLNDVTGVSTEGTYLIGKLAVNYIRRTALSGGKAELGQVVDAVLKDLNNPTLKARDVYEALNARSPRAVAALRSEATQQVAELKTQARLLTQIDDAEKGIFAESRSRSPSSTEVQRLRTTLRDLRTSAYRSGADARQLDATVKRINDLQDQLANHYRSIKEKRPIPSEGLQSLRLKMNGLRREMNVEDRLSDIQNQLKTGEFKMPVRRRSQYTSPELERNQIALKRAKQDWRSEINKFEPVTFRTGVRETASFLRTMKATADMSATLRQGLWLSASRPATAAKAFGKSFRAFLSQDVGEQIDNAIRNSPNQLIRDQAGLSLTDFGGTLGQREEFFASNLAERLPVIGALVRASDRSMTTTLNLLRTAAFDDFVEKFPNATLDEMKAWANWVNVASGRGDLGAFKPVATELSTVIFAPRFTASRIQTPFMLTKYWQMPRVRQQIAKDYAATVGLGLSALALADLAGLQVGVDPRASDFGKIRFGDTRVDIWAGVQQPVRLLARIMLGLTDRTGLTGKDLADQEKQVDPINLVSRFAAFKLSPMVTLPLELYRGQTAVGDPVTPTQTAARALLPLVYEGVYDTYKLAGVGPAAAVGAMQFLGLNADTYQDSETQTRRTIKALLGKGKANDAFKVIYEWNSQHPDNQIRTVQ
jgi:hypothetical protein